jgi:hypothetical protein
MPAGTFWWLVTIRSLSRWSEHRSANSTRRLPVQGSAVTILGRDCGDHYRIEVCEILYHQYVVRRLKGALMSFKPNISRIIHRVMPCIGLRGSLAADRTARMLHLLLATLAVWMAAAFFSTIPFAAMSFSTDIQYGRCGSELRHCTRVAPARPLPARQSGLPRRHLDLGDARLLFLWRCTQPGSAALRVLAGFGGMAPWI